MNDENRRRVVRTIKTALLALVITLLLVVMVGSNRHKPKHAPPKPQNLEQRVSKLEASLRDSREMLAEARDANRALREMLSELRGIHNDCQRNATDNFLREHRNQTAR